MYKEMYSLTVNKSNPEYFENQCWNSHYFAHKQITSVESAVISYFGVFKAVIYEGHNLNNQELLI
jgi:hypothetical protein